MNVLSAQRPMDGRGPRVYKYSLIGAGKERKMRIFIDSYIWHDGARIDSVSAGKAFLSDVG